MMALKNEEFKVKDDDTKYYLSQCMTGDYFVWWYDEDKLRREADYTPEVVKQHFDAGNWKFVADAEGKAEVEHTGGSVNYYKVHVANPTTLPKAYDAEANDIIESLGLTFAEGNLFKAIWRMAADRNGKKKKGNNSVYDAEKLVFFAERVLVQEKAKRDESK